MTAARVGFLLLAASVAAFGQPQITTTSLPDGVVGRSYSTRLQATGGTPPYRWSALPGTLPSGLTLSRGNGEIAGIPTTAGTRAFGVLVVDDSDRIDTASLSITIAPVLTISSSSLPNGTIGAPYSATLAATGGRTPYTWLVTGLPAGLTANSSGAVSGTPTTAGSSSVSARVTDADGISVNGSFTVTIAPPPAIGTSSLPNGTVGAVYAAQLNATGGTTPHTWSVTGLPAGLTATSAGAISGTPSQAGSSNVTARVTDAAGATATRSWSVTIAPPVAIATASLPNGTVGASYTAQLNATGGTSPHTWSVSGLPPGLTASSAGAISGTPTQAGPFNVSARITDDAGATATRSYSVTIAPAVAISTSSLPNGIVGAAYSAQLNATGGTTPYTWSVTGLPQGLTASAAGAISGTPSQAGPFEVSARVTDSNGATATRSYTLSIAPALAIATASLPNGSVGVAYSASLNATGGAPPYTWALSGLPPGLTANSSGSISGAPSQMGTFDVSARVTDDTGASASRSYTVTIGAALAVDTPSLPDGSVGAAYSAQLNASGGTAPYTWTVTGLPDGLTATAGGAIGGTPTRAASFTVDARVTDNAGASVARSYAVTIAPATLAIGNTSLPNGTVGAAYSAQLTASGGTPPYTWVVTGLPPGLTAAAGAITGTPAQAGPFTIDVRVTDNAGASAARSYAVTIAPAALAIANASLPNGTVGAAYSAQLTASGGTAPYTWSVTGLPPGVDASASGAISGTPAQAGPFTIDVRVTDNAGAAAARSYPVTIAPAALVIGNASLPDGMVGVVYSAQLNASGGTTPYTWTFTGLPPGTTATAGGGISGTPTQAGPFTISARVTDNGGASASRQYSMTVAPPTLAISTASLPDPTVGAQYSAQLNASGGTPPYTWAVTGLPPGTTATAGGAISGTPTQAGSYTVNAQVTDNAGATATRSFAVTVGASALIIGTGSLPEGAVGVRYSAQLNASGGTAPYTWTITGLPAGLTASAGGAISGTPTQAGSSSVTARVTDNAGAGTSRSYTLNIAGPALAVSTASVPEGRVAAQYSTQLSATGGTPPYTWTVTGLPPGVTALPSGSIGGTPTQAGSFNVTVRVADSAGASATRSFTVTVAAAPVAIAACPAPAAVAGRPYSSAATAAGGTPPYNWTIPSGPLPPGLSLDAATGSIAGTPGQAGNFNFTLRLTDAGGGSATRLCAITVAPALTMDVQNLPSGVVRNLYVHRLTAQGGVPPYTWSVTGGVLPPGVILDPSGILSGTPQSAGRFTFRVRVTDQSGAFVEADAVINIALGLSITACAADVGSPGRPYSSAFIASGGEPPYDWQLVNGSVPAGLVLNTRTGGLTGVPQTPGTSLFTVRVSDNRTVVTRECSIRIVPPLAISTPTLAAANVGIAYSDRLNATGGIPPYVWTTIAGALPPGLFLNNGTGQITGTPTHAGDFRFTVRVTDTAGSTRDLEVLISVAANFSIADCPTPVAVISETYVYALAAGGGQSPFSWSLSAGSLPTGLTLNSVSGVITGTPTRLETATFTLRASDATNSITTRACSLRVTPSSLLVSTSRQLPGATIGGVYEVALAAAGGRPPYTWSMIDGRLPTGVQLSSEGVLAGTPMVAGAFMFTVQVTDQDRAIANQVLELRVTPAAMPAVRITGVPEIAAPAQQMFVEVELERSYPAPIVGTLRMRVTPDPGLPEDPAVQFAGGGRALDFTIPVGETRAVFTNGSNGIQTGTVAAAVQFDVGMSAAGLDLTPPQGAATLMRVDRLAPRISEARANRVADGLELVITGFATTREITNATFRFTPAAGASFAQTEFTVDLRQAAERWFSNAQSAEYGSQFTLVQPFRVSGASVNSVAITLANGQGASQPVTVRIE